MKKVTILRQNKTSKTSGFTLIELLVVITIITLLISILLPALSAARDAAQSIQCLSNQRQLGISIVAYEGDHDGYYVNASKTVSSGTQLWDSILLRGGYGPNGQLFLCPSMDSDQATFWKNYADSAASITSTGWQYPDYGYNYAHIGSGALRFYGNTDKPARAALIRHPSQTLILADSQEAYYSSNPRQHGFWDLQYSAGTYAYTGYLDPRHQGGAVNALWADGHASSNKVPTGRTTASNNPYSTLFKRGYYVGEQDNVWDRD